MFWITIGSNTNLYLKLINIFSVVNTIEGDLYDHVMNTRIFTLTIITYSYELQKHVTNGYDLDLIFDTISPLVGRTCYDA